MDRPTLYAKKITHIYNRPIIRKIEEDRRITALSDITLKIESKGLYLFMGPSGSGKTTLFNILSSFLIPTTGIVRINKHNIYSLSNLELQTLRSKTIGYLNQNVSFNFISLLTVKENIAIIQNDLKKINGGKNNENFNDLFVKLGLKGHVLNLKVNQLSSGEQQRVGLYLLMLKNPDILLLDEPTSYLDQNTKQLVIDVILAEVKKNKTILVSSHDPVFLQLSNDIFILHDGKFIKADGLHYMVDISQSEFKIAGKSPDSSFYLEIPQLIFKKIEMNSVYVLKEEMNNNTRIILFFSKIQKEDFENSPKKNWIFLEGERFRIPEILGHLPWHNSSLDWIISANIIKIQLTRK